MGISLKDKRIVTALVFFLAVVLIYELVLPAFFKQLDGWSFTASTHPTNATVISTMDEQHDPSREAIKPEQGADSPESTGQVDVVGVLDESLVPSTLFPILMIDLSTPDLVEYAVERWARQLAEDLLSKGVTPSDLVELYCQCSSSRMRQALALTWSLMGPEEGEEGFLFDELNEPEMMAVVSFALGSLGSEKAIQALTDAILSSERSMVERKALAFGLAQAGARSVPTLLKVVELLISQGETLDPSAFLGAIRNPEARGALKDIVDNHYNDPQVRTMALRGLLSSCKVDDAVLSWAMDLLVNESEDPLVRVNGFKILSKLDPERVKSLVSKLFSSPTTPPEMFEAVLELFAGTGAPGEYVAWVSEKIDGSADSYTRYRALNALAFSRDPSAGKVLIDLYPGLAEEDRVSVLSALHERLVQEDPGAPIPLELISQITQALWSSRTGKNEQDFALVLLAGLEGYREEALRFVHQQLLAPVADPEVRASNLFRSVLALGRDVLEPLEQAFHSTEDLVQRFEIASLLTVYPEFMEDPSAIRFTQQESLPFIREYFLSDPDSILTYAGRQEKAPLYIHFMVNILGRHGSRSDIERFESFRQAVVERSQSWPERSRQLTREVLDDTTERIRDLMLLRQGGQR
ncbi:MAG: hypothetical protein ABIK28_25460 [Planctomycetota bacterium]